MLQKTRAIVLHSLKYSESSLIVHLYTLHFGRQSYILRGIRKGKGKGKVALYQPLNILDLEVSHSGKREIQAIREAGIAHPLQNLCGNPVKETMALFIAEILYRCLREAESNPALFSFLENTIQVLDLGKEGIPNLHLYFLVQLTRFLGFSPENNFGTEAPCFDMYAGRFTAGPAIPGQVLDRNASAKIHRILTMDQSNLSSFQMQGTDRSELAADLIDFYHIHLEGLGPIRTLDIMKEIFNT